jgi:hypothetical protein
MKSNQRGIAGAISCAMLGIGVIILAVSFLMLAVNEFGLSAFPMCGWILILAALSIWGIGMWWEEFGWRIKR